MRRAILIVCLATACGVDLPVPSDARINCARDADCTDGLVCAPLIGRCVTTIDLAAPSIVNAEALAVDRVRVVFSEPVLCNTVATPEAYVITPPLDVLLAAGTGCDDGDALTTEATLFTMDQAAGSPYVLLASGILDGGGNALADSGSLFEFMGFGSPPDMTPPEPLAPANHARVLGGEQALVWTFRPGATAYAIDVATDPDFADPIVGSPFTVASPATTLQLRDLSDVTYYWRMRSDLTAPSETLPVYDFDVLIDTVYVACAGSAPCADAGLYNGNRTRPYTSVQRALAAAAEMSTSLDITTVAVKLAARGPSAVYAGPVVMQWQSVSMTGGWDATFTTRNPDPALTIIEAPGAVLAVGNFPQPIAGLVEGVTLRSTATAPHSATLNIAAASGSLTIRNIVVRGIASALNPLVQVIGGPPVGPNIEDCTFVADIVPGDVGSVVLVVNAAPHITHSDLRFGVATGAAVAMALEVQGPLPGEVLVEDTTLAAANAIQNSSATLVNVGSESAAGITFRRVLATSGAAASSEVLDLQNNPRVIVEDSVLSAGAGTVNSHVAGDDRGGGQLLIRNSVLQAASGPNPGGETIQIQEDLVLELTNSVLIGSTGGSPPMRVVEGHPIITNTILVPRSGATCVEQPWDAVSNRPTWGTPTSFQNNALVACAQTYVIANDGSGTPPPTVATTSSEVDSLSGLPLRATGCTDVTCPQARFVANVVLPSVTLGDIFVDVDGPDNNLLTVADNDYHLRATANVALRQGGLGPGVGGCAPIGQFASCNIPLMDIDGQTRTAPYSIGPDEAP